LVSHLASKKEFENGEKYEDFEVSQKLACI
jgi:hypothetical protein